MSEYKDLAAALAEMLKESIERDNGKIERYSVISVNGDEFIAQQVGGDEALSTEDEDFELSDSVRFIVAQWGVEVDDEVLVAEDDDTFIAISITSDREIVEITGGGSGALPEAEAYHYFPDESLGSLTTADTGQTYHSTATSSPFEMTVQNSGGVKVLTHSAVSGSGAGYAQLPLPDDARWFFARVRFQPGSTPGSTIALASPEQSIALGGIPQMGQHAVFNPAGAWEAGVWEGTPTASYDLTGDSGALAGASTLGFAPFDGVTECLMGFTVDDHGMMRMLLPNGDVVTPRDSRYRTLCGPWAFIEIFVTDAATDVKPEIVEWQAGTTESSAMKFLMDRGYTAELVRKMLERYITIGLAVANFQPLDAQLTDVAAINPATSDVIASDGTNFIGRTWAQIKGSLAIAMADVSGLVSALAAKLDASALDTDGTLSANSDAKVATQKATKTYADTMLPKAGGTMSGGIRANNGNNSVNGIHWRADNNGINSPSTGRLVFATAGTERMSISTALGFKITLPLSFAEDSSQFFFGGENYVRTSTDVPVFAPYIFGSGVTYTFNAPSSAVVQIIACDASNTDPITTSTGEVINPGEAGIFVYSGGVWTRV